MTPYERVETYRKKFPSIPRAWSAEQDALRAKACPAADVDMRLAYLRKMKPKQVGFGQPRWQSWLESLCNTAVGFVVAIASQVVVFPIFGIHVPLSTNLGIGMYFTAISVVRSQLMRRAFNRLHMRQERAYVQQIAGEKRQ